MRAGARSVQFTAGIVAINVEGIAPNTRCAPSTHTKGNPMNGIIWLVGAVVIVLFIFSYFGLR
jgi:hypothetical protein